jgi:UDP-N-acetylmuramoyl-L-alanyl-D-glutamate--2,6-diaminopimelate ligase
VRDLVESAAGRVRLASGEAETRLTGVTLDSRAVRPGDLYAALPGSRAHGANFGPDAVARGAVAVLTDEDGRRLLHDRSVNRAVLVADHPRAELGAVSATVYGRPAADLLLLGVTGTNGKTTTTYLMDAVLRAAGRTTGLVGTVETRVAEQAVPSVRTTPEAPDLHALLALMRERGVQVCCMEVSSQALAQHRVDGAPVDLAGFTNFSQDHLELHGDMDSYLAAKALLLTPAHSRRAVVVVDDEGSRRVAASAGVPVTTLSGFASTSAHWQVLSRTPRDGGTDFALAGPDGQLLDLRCPLPGDFNVLNAALAAVMLLQAGLTVTQVRDGLRDAGGVPGRMERVPDPAGRLAVVDYAHTPDAVAAALEALRPAVTGRLLLVLGAGGDRDPSKRGPMGAAAVRGADLVVVTDDNPRSEVPAQIRQTVLSAARTEAERQAAAGRDVAVIEIADRATAIAHAVALLGRDDVLLVAGKGHEQGQEVGGVVHPFDDRTEVARALGAQRVTP